MDKPCIKADKFNASYCGKFNKLNRGLKSKQCRREMKKLEEING